jgi:hypothetical protein
MTIVPASRLSRAEMHMLGNNVAFAPRRSSPKPAAVKRSLPTDEEGRDESAAPVGNAQWAGQEAVA